MHRSRQHVPRVFQQAGEATASARPSELLYQALKLRFHCFDIINLAIPVAKWVTISISQYASEASMSSFPDNVRVSLIWRFLTASDRVAAKVDKMPFCWAE